MTQVVFFSTPMDSDPESAGAICREFSGNIVGEEPGKHSKVKTTRGHCCLSKAIGELQ
jgi:hypothetical protein